MSNSSEEQQMLAKISQLAGQINRHKNQQAGIIPAPSYNHPGGFAKGWSRGGHYQRGGYRVAKPAPHRNRTLVLNGGKSETESGANSDASTSSWVTKSDRHLQLIKSNVYEKESQARTKAIEQTRLQKLKQKDDRERAKLVTHFGRVAHRGSVGSANGAPAKHYEVMVNGIPFYVTKDGSKLVKVSGDLGALGATPKTAVIGGVRFYRSKSGNLYRHGIIKAQRQAGAVKKLNQPCQLFSTTGTSLLQLGLPEASRRPTHGKDSADCINLFIGSCHKGPLCRYIHDASKVSACRDFLQKGICQEGETCDLSHELIPQRTPHCLHFAKGNCTNPNCRYAHCTVPPGALVCRPFGIYGYCEKGANCSERHVFECPDFSNTGTCKRKGCKLLHRERASVLRKANARETSADNGEDMMDVSSDDDDSVDSDDVDSDEVEEFIGDDELPDPDFATQKDFIKL